MESICSGGVWAALELCRLLIKAGADVDAQVEDDDSEEASAFCDNLGWSTLHFWAATCDSDTDLLDFALEADADFEAEEEGGCTPLHFAATFGLRSTVHLLAAGADPFAEDDEGETPLECCLRRSTDRLRDLRLHPQGEAEVLRADAPTPRDGLWLVNCDNQDGQTPVTRRLRFETLIVAAVIQAAEDAGEYGSERARAAFAAAAVTGAESGAQPSALACLRLAADGVPTAWERANARAWPHPWRDTVRCLLLCRRRQEVTGGLGLLSDDLFDAIVARAARGGGVWPTIVCTLEFRVDRTTFTERVSLLDISFPVSSPPAGV